MFRSRSDDEISDMHQIKIHNRKWPRSNVKQLDLVRTFVFTHVQQIPICEQKKLMFFQLQFSTLEKSAFS